MFQIRDAQILWLDAVQGRNPSSQPMKLAATATRLLDADDIHRALDHTDEGGIPPWIGADAARGLFREGAADGAVPNPRAGLDDGVGELADGSHVALDQMEGESFGGAGPYAGQLVQR